jgi:hypothetical protein
LFDNDGEFARMRNLSGDWTTNYSDGGGGMSAAPIYLALMALAGAYLIKDGLKYFFIKEEKPETTTTIQETKKEDNEESIIITGTN